MSLIDQLAELRARQGKEPLPDPRVISGDSTPAPQFNRPTYPGEVEDPEPFDDLGEAQSPLLRTPQPTIAQEMTAPAPVLPKFDLLVVDGEAAYLGRPVSLNTQERKAIIRIVLGGLSRIVQEQLQQVNEGTKKRGRKPREPKKS